METPTFDSPIESIRLKFQIQFLEKAENFLFGLATEAQEKITYNLNKARVVIDPKLFKKLTDVLWEFRIKSHGIQYRFLAFWDKATPVRPLVIITHGFIKKTGKLPKSELKLGLEIRRRYFQNKSDYEKKNKTS